MIPTPTTIRSLPLGASAVFLGVLRPNGVPPATYQCPVPPVILPYLLLLLGTPDPKGLLPPDPIQRGSPNPGGNLGP